MPCLHVHDVRIQVPVPWSDHSRNEQITSMNTAMSYIHGCYVQVPVPWSDHSRNEQITSVATAMAYIHNSSKAAVERLYSHQRFQHKFFTPLTYQEFVHIFKTVAAFIAKRERDSIERYESGLGRMDEAFESIAAMKKEVTDLMPRKRNAQQQVNEHVQNVEKQRLEYIEVRLVKFSSNLSNKCK